MSAGAFAKIATATATGGGNNIRDGVFELMVEKVHMQHGHTGECFIAEFRVLKSSSNGATNEKGDPIVPNKVGSTCSMVCNITKHASAAGNAKAFVENALSGLGITADKITADVMAWVCSENNPLRGLKVVDETYRGVNKGRDNPKNAGQPLTLNKWRGITQTKEDVQKQRAWLDVTPACVDVAPAAPAAPAGGSAPAQAAPAEVAATVAPAQAAPAGGGIDLLGGILGVK